MRLSAYYEYFQMKDMGQRKFFLDVKIDKNDASKIHRRGKAFSSKIYNGSLSR